MINLSSLSALIRAIRTSNAADDAAPAVMRVPSIRPVAEDDAGAMLSTALRQQPWSTTSAVPEGVPADEVRGAPMREARPGAPDYARRPGTHANAATPAPAAYVPPPAQATTLAGRIERPSFGGSSRSLTTRGVSSRPGKTNAASTAL